VVDATGGDCCSRRRRKKRCGELEPSERKRSNRVKESGKNLECIRKRGAECIAEGGGRVGFGRNLVTRGGHAYVDGEEKKSED